MFDVKKGSICRDVVVVLSKLAAPTNVHNSSNAAHRDGLNIRASRRPSLSTKQKLRDVLEEHFEPNAPRPES